MKYYSLPKPGDGYQTLQMREGEIPKPTRTQVLIRMNAHSLNYRDINISNGAVPGIKDDLIPLSDGAGEVVEIGADVTRFRVGDFVAPIFRQNWIDGGHPLTTLDSDIGGNVDGTLAEYRVFDEQMVVALPSFLTPEQAATLPCAGVTAWSAITDPVPLKPGETVLIQGTGGVSLFALQFAKLCGARVIATSSSEDKLVRLKELGADVVINYADNPDWDRVVLDETEGHGVDRVVDVAGGETLVKSAKATRIGGRISLVGALTSGSGGDAILQAIMRYLSLHGVQIGSRAHFEAMNRAIAAARMVPVVDRTFSFDAPLEAYDYFKERGQFGKVVISHNAQ